MTTIEIAAGTSAEEIQILINNAPDGATLSLSAGQFSFDRTIVIDRDDITVQGAGSERTKIAMTADAAGQAAFQIGHELYEERASGATALAKDAGPGATAITLASSDGFQVGDTLCIETANTDAFFDEIGDTLWRKDDAALRSMLVNIVAIEGDTVIFEPELVYDHDSNLTTVSRHAMVSDVALGGFSLTSGLGESDPGDFSNTVAAGERSSLILVAGAKQSSLSDIKIIDAVSHGLTMDDSIGITVDGLVVDGALNKGSGGNGYAVWLRNVVGSDLDNLTLMDTRHAVVFGSWNSAVGNTVHVLETNRDINFHGGRDVNNTVIVDSSIRTGEEQSYMASTLFFNEGERYGAPTDMAANTVSFGTVVGTVRSDLVFASDDGAVIETLSAADTVWLGAGNDLVSLGTGHDTVMGVGGLDTIDGGSGLDTLIVDREMSGVNVTREGDAVTLWDMTFRTTLTKVETIVFRDGTMKLSELGEVVNVDALLTEYAGERLTLYEGGSRWERAYFDGSGLMGDTLEAAAFDGAQGVIIIGNLLSNHIMGGSGGDLIEGRGGNDRLLGRGGDDTILGGEGADTLVGGMGADTLLGGAGSDTLWGNAGADTFMIEGDTDVVADFSRADGDTLVFNSAGPEANTALAIWLETGAVTGGLTVAQVEARDTGAEAEAESVSGLQIAWHDEAVILQNVALSEMFV